MFNRVAPNLYTDRLKLVPLGLEHASIDYVSWMNDPEVNKYLESGGDYTIEKLHDFLCQVEIDNILFWAIHTIENNQHIGNIKINPINLKHKYAEYGIMMGDKSEWGKGYAKEATIKIIDYCFNSELNLRKVNLGVYAKNIAAIELYKKIGFTQEGRFSKHVITTDGFDDILRMAIFNPNYD
jgi:RimJ/RimL family protein N-acetyltransferase